MGKSKGGKSKGGGASKVPKCTCEDPYRCNCGNRPERPSRGHKWDPETQQWGGKGHKQKGASGQTTVVGQQAKTTAVGNTQVAQWQQLPSAILKDYCRKQKRPPPKFKEMMQDHSKSKFKVRCIVPDAKDPDKDLILFPAQPVNNEEQAKEEAALLALLHLTPSLPHERKLPDPYKTTWLSAVQALKQQSNQRNKPTASNNDAGSTQKRQSKATANTNLALATSHVSAADKRQQREKAKLESNARIRRHMAVQMANRNHPVFLSVQLRRMIQLLLQGGDTNSQQLKLLEEEKADHAPELMEFDSDRQQYVEERLHQEGFTRRQARTAFEEVSKAAISGNKNNDDENLWDGFYDECLQWLCVHLPEDQLPEGFDPRGQTLDVIAPTRAGNKALATDSGANPETSAQALALVAKFGLSDGDAKWLLSQVESKSTTVEEIFWARVSKLASVTEPDALDEPMPQEEMEQLVQDEKEALLAMFPEGEGGENAVQFNKREDGFTVISINTTMDDPPFTLNITVDMNTYPGQHPQQITCHGSSNIFSKFTGVAFHVELAKFASTLALGEPMVFEIYGQAQTLLQSLDDLPKQNLQDVSVPSMPTGNMPKQATPGATASAPVRKTFKTRRPRERGVFWSTPPAKTPPAIAFPKLKKSLEMQRQSLPAGKARQDFLSILQQAENGSRVVLVTGDTGCGKTTQIPQFILEQAPKTAKIVVAQPRRLAATGVAARVAEERGESKPGTGSVGYVVRGDSAISKNTRLLFCTFGILLRQLQCDNALDCVTHILIDEVHERNLDGDVLMALLKEMLTRTPNLQIVLMSATLDADKFAAYWGQNTPRMHIPGRTFPVQDFMLEDVLTLTGYNPPKNPRKRFFSRGQQQNRPRKATPWNDSELSDREEDEEEEAAATGQVDKTASSQQQPSVPLEERVKRIDESQIDYVLLGQLVKRLIQENAMGHDGSILVFLPGAPEINQAKTMIGKMTGGLQVRLLPLHGGLQSREQNIVFDPCPGSVKVILSTNVAETSITIPDCTVVIDTCREKQSSYDPVNRMPLLIEVFASKASLKQRRGRAGRVREGKCYKLVSGGTYSKLHDHTPPEITRCALDQTLLSLLFLGVERGNGEFLRTLLDPPDIKSVAAATLSLHKIGALEPIQADELQLTPLGVHLAGIPAPPVVGKMLVMGSILGCRRAALAMAAGISTGRSPYLRIDTPRNKRSGQESLEETKHRLVLEERAKVFALSGNSDHAMLAEVFMNLMELPTGGGARKQYCEKLGLSFTGMRDILQLVNQYDSALSNSGFRESPESDRNARSWRVLRTCAIAAMAPGQLVRVHRPSTKYASTVEGAREKDGVAKELKFFIRPADEDATGGKDDRVFIHPSSALFSVGNYSCPWLVYHSMVKTSKPFLRDATECSAYSLLLFGGNLEVEARNSVITIDNWVKLSANARIGALIRGLRGKMDELMTEKVKNPSIDISNTPTMELIVKLLCTDGLGS